MLSRLELNSAFSAYCSLDFPGSRDSPDSASQVSGITGMPHRSQLIFVFLVETRFHNVGQSGLKLPTSCDPPASAYQSSGITGMSHHARTTFVIFIISTLFSLLFLILFRIEKYNPKYPKY